MCVQETFLRCTDDAHKAEGGQGAGQRATNNAGDVTGVTGDVTVATSPDSYGGKGAAGGRRRARGKWRQAGVALREMLRKRALTASALWI